jgi:hypothetical protein
MEFTWSGTSAAGGRLLGGTVVTAATADLPTVLPSGWRRTHAKSAALARLPLELFMSRCIIDGVSKPGMVGS